jgi:tripartite-type tricarboxylate transporter receptor subunit TctC
MGTKQSARAIAAAIALFCASLPSFAQSDKSASNYPTRPVRFITPAAPGGTTDILARLFSARLTEVFKQQFIVDNRASANGVVATELTAKAPPDGYTLLLAYHQNIINAVLIPNLPYHAVNDFTPITQLTQAGFLLVVSVSHPAKNVKEFIEWTKTTKEKLNFGSAGTGSGGHLAGELYKIMTGVQGQHIPYKGTAPSLNALVGGEYQFSFAGLAAAQVLVRGGKLRALAVTTPKRIGALPDVPAMAEALPGFVVVGWYGVMGPAKMPKAIVTRLNTELVRALNRPDTRERITEDGSEPVGSSPEDFRKFLLADLEKWTKVVKESGAKAD